MHKRVLEIVTFAISIGTEFIENEAENVKKNDCETKMLKRFAERLKKEYLRFTRVLKKACCIWALYELSELKEYGRILSWDNRVTGWLDLIPEEWG